jgi:truncated hemoglobin YjbI
LPRLTGHHFERWLQLWRETVAALCSEELAFLLNRKAQMIAESLLNAVTTYHESAVRKTAEATRGAL